MPTFDLLVAGGGIAGCSVAREAALRGLTVALVEKGDIASGTSGRSTKLLHGGLRYLEHGHLGLVREALREREITARLAPHLALPLPFVVPSLPGARPGRLVSRLGIGLYDFLAGDSRLGRGKFLSRRDVALVLADAGAAANGGVGFFDRQTDDVRLTLAVARDAARRGAIVLPGHEVVSWTRRSGRVGGAICKIVETGVTLAIDARVVVNATGPWADRLRALAGREEPSLRPTRGAHLVLPDLGLQAAVLFPGARPGHRLFAIPWRGCTLLGTTDVDDDGNPDTVSATREDVAVLLGEARRLFPGAKLKEADVLSTFAGLRPLMRASGVAVTLSREHRILDEDGLLSVVGGKLTTWRVIGSDVAAAVVAALGRKDHAANASAVEPLPGGSRAPARDDPRLASIPMPSRASLIATYGSEAVDVASFASTDRAAAQPIAAGESIVIAQVDFAVRSELARNLEDVVLRRLALGHDPRRALAAAPAIAARLRSLLGWSATRETEEIRALDRTLAPARATRGVLT